MTELEAIAALIDHETAHFKRLPHFPAAVVKQNGDLTVDVQPDSPYLPGLSALPLRTFVPGAVVKVQAGTRVQVVFENGDTKRPVAVPLFDQDAGALLQLAIVSSDIRLGSANPSDAAALASKVEARLSALEASLAGHGHPVSTTGSATAQMGATTGVTGVGGLGSPAVASSIVKISS